MPVRVFQGHDIEGFAAVEREINNWLRELPRGAIVKHLDTTTLHPLNRAPIFLVTIYYSDDDLLTPK